jgi:hypothetical protein
MAEERDAVFSKNQFVPHINGSQMVGDSIPKVCNPIETEILRRLLENRQLDFYFTRPSPHVVYYTRKLRYFVQFFDFIPLIKNSKGKTLEPSELKKIYLLDEAHKEIVISILNSSLFFWFFSACSDVRNVNKREINAFRCSLDAINSDVVSQVRNLCRTLMNDFDRNFRMLTSDYGRHGVLHIQSFQPRLSKSILDEIDRVLAAHYGFTDEELDFPSSKLRIGIPSTTLRAGPSARLRAGNYDIKYRMGRDAGSEED